MTYFNRLFSERKWAEEEAEWEKNEKIKEWRPGSK